MTNTEIINWPAYVADNYRLTSDTATALTARQPRWVVAEFEINDEGEFVYDALTEPMTLAEAVAWDTNELTHLVAQAESTDDYQERERLIDSMGPLIRAQVAEA